MRLVTPETSAHWYTRDGEPRYDATLREARKENLLPSVTSITKLWPKGALEAWKIEQGIMAALTLPRHANEPLDAFARRVVTDGQSQAKTTAAWGTEFHGLCERLHEGDPWLPPKHMKPHFDLYADWFHANVIDVIRTEHPVTNLHHGYAGKLDLLVNAISAGRALGDIKSRSVKNGRPAFYDEQPIQLVAYGMALPDDDAPNAYFSVIINRDAPDPPYVRWWTPTEIAEAWKNFLCLRDLWVAVNRFDPREEAVAA